MSLIFDLFVQDISYDIVDVNGSWDFLVLWVLIGVKWSGLVKIIGWFKLGVENWDFDSNLCEDFIGLIIDVGVIWKFRIYLIVDMSLICRISEFGFLNLIVNIIFEVDW